MAISLWDLASPAGRHISMVYPSYANGPEAAIVNVCLLPCVEVYEIAVEGRVMALEVPRPSAMFAPIPCVASIFTLQMLFVQGL